MSQLFLGKFDNNGTVGSYFFTFFNASTSVGSPVITNIDSNVNKLRAGQTIEDFGAVFPTPPTIVSIDSPNSITVNAAASVSTTTFLGVSTPPDTYFFSGSMLDPNSVIFNYSITGSNDPDFDSADGQYAILAAVKGGFNDSGAEIYGVYHAYNITSVVYRDPNNIYGLEMFVEFAEQDLTEDQIGEYLSPNETTYAFVKRSNLEQLTPSIDNKIIDLELLPNDIGIASFNIAVTDFLDDLTITDIYQDDTLVKTNTRGINFTGNVEVTLDSSIEDAVQVNIIEGTSGTGGAGTSGTSGTSGPPGTSGTSAASAGTSGSSGTSGTSGFSGT